MHISCVCHPSFTGLMTGGVPGLNIDLSKVLHGEQYTELLAPFPTDPTTLASNFKVSAVLDKGTGLVLVLDVVTRDTNDDNK